MKRTHFLPQLAIFVVAIGLAHCEAAIKAGAAQREITPTVGLEIQHYYRQSVGVHDPLLARCLYLQDDVGNAVAILCLDLIFGDFDTCDQLRAEIRQKTGIPHALINFSHNHSSAALGPRGRSRVSNDEGSLWNDATLDAILSIVLEAKSKAELATFRAGRAKSEVGFNRRLVNTETGRVHMGVNREGPRVPWVNVLVVESQQTGKTTSVLFETAGHPVIVPHTTKKISADYPGAAVNLLREKLGEDVIAMFGQGCGGNINGFPLRSSYKNAIQRGRDLGLSVLRAMDTSQPVVADRLDVKFSQAALPSHPLPSSEQLAHWIEENKENPARLERLNKMKDLVMRAQQPPSRRLDVYALALGEAWCLTTLPHEMFCQYELWIDKHAPFRHTMTFGYTNGYEGYVAVDAAWKLGPKGGYEAASLPNWGGQVHTKHFGPPAVGAEAIIKDTIRSLWPTGRVAPKPSPVRPADDAPQPLSPAASAARIRLPKDFRIELVASEPLVQDPSCITFDERGRLFVCELHGYNIEGHLDVQELNKTGMLDREVRRVRWEFQEGRIAEEAAQLQYGVVKMLLDANRDGVMDRAVVWAEDLPPCYGVLPANGGILVVCAPDIVFLADRDGDGKPEVRERLFTGFRTQTLERGINNPRWGLDNWIYVGAGGSGGTITGPHLKAPVLLAHSDFRIRPDGSAIEPVTGRVGTFGMTINDVGDRFPSTGGRPAMYALPLPHRYLARNPYVPAPETNHSAASYHRGFRISQPHPWRVQRQRDPAWVKFYGARETNSNYFSGGCSNEFYGDNLFPEPYRGNIFYCEPSLNIVHRCVIRRQGPGYQGQRAPEEEQSEFLASTDQWFRPMNLRVGPEGALYIVDMYREIIEDYSAIPRFLQQQYGLNKGSDHGRIWRLVPKSFQYQTPADLSNLNDAELAKVTSDDTVWRRRTAQRLLVERQSKTSAHILSAQLRPTHTHHAWLHALYTLDGLGQLTKSDVVQALRHEHYGVRVHALRLSERWLDSEPSLWTEVLALADDEDPSVRIQIALTLGQANDPQVVEALTKLAKTHASERWMTPAILSSALPRTEALLTSLLSEVGPSSKELLRALSATLAGQRRMDAVSRVLRNLAGREEMIQVECLAGLVDGLSRGNEPISQSADGWASVAVFLKSDSADVRDLATKLTPHLAVANDAELQKIFATAERHALDETLSDNKRRQAIQTLASSPYDVLAPVVVKLLDPRQSPRVQFEAIDALGTSTHQRVGTDLLRNWSSHTPSVREAVIKAILARNDRLPALVSAIETNVVLPSEVSASTREQLIATTDEATAARAKRLLRSVDADAALKRRLEGYRASLSAPRNVKNGEQVFTKNCLGCHKLRDQGHDVGPHLGTIVNRPDETLLIDILDPSSRIEPEFRTYLVTTDTGLNVSGIFTSESPTSITLLQEEKKRETVLRRNIELMRASNVSLMPSNLHELITPQDMADLIAFLRHAYGVRPGQTARIGQLRELGATVFTREDKVVEVSANGTPISDQQLQWLAGFEEMTDLSLENTRIGNAGISHLSDLQMLEWLNLYRCPVGDEALETIKQLKSLQHLPIGHSRVTDEGLKQVAGMTQLLYLGLRGNKVTDDGLQHLAGLTNLTGLHLGETRITDSGLHRLRALGKLRQLWLNDTQITDSAIEHLKKMRSLSELHIDGTGITADGVRELQRTLPQCRIISTRTP